MNDLADDASDVSMALGVVQVPELGGSLVQARVGSYWESVFNSVVVSPEAVFEVGTD